MQHILENEANYKLNYNPNKEVINWDHEKNF